jgi:hypothetical protein
MTGQRTRRHVTHTDACEAVRNIAERRHRHGDPDEEKLPDQPLAVVEYVLTCQQVHAGVLAEDVLDALTLLEYAREHVPAIPARLDRHEHDLLVTGVGAGLSLSALAAPLGLRSRQAVEHRILRHRSAERGGLRHEVAERQARAAEQAEHRWCRRHGPRLVAAATLLLDQAAGFAEAGLTDDLDDLATTLAEVPAPDTDTYAKKVRYVAIRIRLLAADLAAWEAETDRTRQSQMAALLKPAVRLATDQQRFT